MKSPFKFGFRPRVQKRNQGKIDEPNTSPKALKIPNLSLIRGDQKCLSVAAASIVAKVSRDRIMRDIYEPEFPNYGFESNKGYGSKQHLEALKELGPTRIHRMSFRPLSEMNLTIG